MPTELPDINVPLIAVDDDDPEYDAYAEFEVRAFAKKLSDFSVMAEKFDASLAAILSTLLQNPKFEEKLLRDFKHERFPLIDSRSIVLDIKDSHTLAQTLTRTLTGFLELAKEYHPELNW